VTVPPTSRHEGLSDGRLLYRPEDAATILSVTRTRVYDLIRSGQLPSVKLGRSRRIPGAALHDFVDSLTAEGAK